ncbi:hypothetical protein [Ramlibacter tataouinensis]|uniref:Uncharacterized protein n=1 Tax=Ramlibacter tataouinensis (strain ATCC BAA-407 / DSM 14655 / LMG 21543 / TTB310) TaxID=365046 RepID=F5XZW2_RAMTT|nr:hypothetical protein [Ramlibacter tataouinensis]AEG93323.1 Hypothetical protein Rta_22270 [Ramlibacter tataouinensis TTB310]
MNEALPDERRSNAQRNRMWRHYCRAEHVLISVGEGERCNWCLMAESAEPQEQRPALRAPQSSVAV